MAKYEPQTAFFVFRVTDDKISPQVYQSVLIKEMEPHYGHAEYADAESWIAESGERQMNYTILKIFRQP